MSKARIWKQDPSVEEIGVRMTFVPSGLVSGPKDADGTMQIGGMRSVWPNLDGDFIYDPNENPHEFDAVHTLTVVKHVVTMWERALRWVKNDDSAKITWAWGGSEPLTIYPRAGEDANAYYYRTGRSLSFYYFHPRNDSTQPLVYTCRSFDIVAHETGHAVLDALCPLWLSQMTAQSGGLHEAFGDITSILTMLSQMDQCEAIIAHSKGRLHDKSFFNQVAEQFGEAVYGHKRGLRNADNDLKMSEVDHRSVHELSNVFTGAFYDILADLFDEYRKPALYDPAETLFRVGKHMTYLFLTAVLNQAQSSPTFASIANDMIAAEDDTNRKDMIRNQFKRREVVGIAFAEPAANELRFDECSASLQQRD